MFNPCTLDGREGEEEHQKMDCYVQPLYTGYKGSGGGASEDGLLCLTLITRIALAIVVQFSRIVYSQLLGKQRL